MKTLLVLFCGLSTFLASFAASAGPEMVEFPCVLSVGDSIELRFTKTRKQSGIDVGSMDTSFESVVQCKVVEENSQGLVLSWRANWDDMTEVLSQAGLPDNVRWIQDLVQEMANHVLLIQTDTQCVPIALVNEEETATKINTMMQHLLDNVSVNEEQRAQLEPLLSGLLGPEVLSTRVLQDANLFFMFTGGSFELGEEYGYEDALPNLMNGPPIPAQVVFEVTSVDRDAGTAQITYEQRTDEDAFRALMEDMFKKAPDGEEVLKGLRESKLDIHSDASYLMNLDTGLPIRVTFERSMRMGTALRTDGISIESELISSK